MKYLKEELDIKAGIKKFKNWYNHRDIYDICKKYNIDDYHINPDGTIDVHGNVNLYDKGLKEIPLKFGNVSGYFDCGMNNLTNLIGSPKRVEGWFSCWNENLTSLEGCPEYIGGTFYCYDTTRTVITIKNLWSFDHFPRHAKRVYLIDTPIKPIFDLFQSEYLADGGKFFTTSWSLMEFFWDMDPVYPGKIIIKWRLEKFLEGLNKELTTNDIKAIEKIGWKII